jgi:hypothetical protein
VFLHCDHVDATRAQTSGHKRRDHLVQQQPHPVRRSIPA